MSNRVVIVTGSRTLTDRELVFRELDALGPELVVEGGARGADALGKAWAVERGRRSVTYPANWTAHGRAAGRRRNQQMLDAHPTAVVLAFPRGGPGTADCMRRARGRNMIVLER